MALADLVARLERDAQGQVEAIGQRADAEARAIDTAAALAAAELAAERLARQRTERQVILQRERAEARRQARARVLGARHALVTRVFDRARQLASEAAGTPRYRAAVPAHLDEALSYLVGLDVRVRCSETTEPLLRSLALQRSVTLEIDPSMGPGLVVDAADGSVTVDNTLAARLARLEPQLAIDLLAEVDRGRG